MTAFRDSWSLEMALEVLNSSSVDSDTWSDAVKWLLLYGPPDIKEIINYASSYATTEHFPELQPTGYDKHGNPCYDIGTLADTLGITEEEVLQKLSGLTEKDLNATLSSEDVQKVQ